MTVDSWLIPLFRVKIYWFEVLVEPPSILPGLIGENLDSWVDCCRMIGIGDLRHYGHFKIFRFIGHDGTLITLINGRRVPARRVTVQLVCRFRRESKRGIIWRSGYHLPEKIEEWNSADSGNRFSCPEYCPGGKLFEGGNWEFLPKDRQAMKLACSEIIVAQPESTESFRLEICSEHSTFKKAPGGEVLFLVTDWSS